MTQRTHVRARVTLYAPHRGGRPCMPEGDGYAPYLRAECLSEDHAIRINGFPRDAEFETPYDVELEIMYRAPAECAAIVPGTKFQLVEGIKRIGEGLIASQVGVHSSTGEPSG